jgi:hypothetical protein
VAGRVRQWGGRRGERLDVHPIGEGLNDAGDADNERYRGVQIPSALRLRTQRVFGAGNVCVTRAT